MLTYKTMCVWIMLTSQVPAVLVFSDLVGKCAYCQMPSSFYIFPVTTTKNKPYWQVISKKIFINKIMGFTQKLFNCYSGMSLHTAK